MNANVGAAAAAAGASTSGAAIGGGDFDANSLDSMNIGLIEYLGTFQPAKLDNLYECPAACIALFRELSSFAQNFILRLVFVEEPIPQMVTSTWLKSTDDYKETSDLLVKLHIWKFCRMPTGLPGWLLTPSFRKGLKTAWLGGGEPRALYTSLSPDKHKPELETLDNYAIGKRWDSILNFMASASTKDCDKDGTGLSISDNTKTILVKSGLIEMSAGRADRVQITPAGFQFLLMDISSQIWYFLRRSLELMSNQIDCLSFLFELNFTTFGRDYATEGISDVLQEFLQHLREIGLIYQRKRKDGRFYPTRLMVGLFEAIHENKVSSSLATTTVSSSSNVKRQGFIVVETNYRVYAYTESPLQIALFALFVELNYKFPKFIVGFITRDSIRQAFKFGITAKQITHYLTMHAHPKTATRGTIIPATVIDQIFLWEQERNRLVFTEGVLYSQFNSQPDYEVLRKYANDLGVIVVENPSRRLLVVTRAAHEEVRRFWRRFKKEKE